VTPRRCSRPPNASPKPATRYASARSPSQQRSRLGIIERYARQVEVAGTGRWTTAASHDADYTGTIQILHRAEASPAVSQISLFTRDGLVYDNRRNPTGQWTTRTSAVDILNEARDTPLTRLQCTALANRLADTLDRLERTGSTHPALNEMATQVEKVLGPFVAVQLPACRDEPTKTVGAGPVRDLGPGLDQAEKGAADYRLGAGI
jgi:hypothetical protein